MMSTDPIPLANGGRARLIAQVRLGYPIKVASRRARVSYPVVKEWLLKGADPATTSKFACPPEYAREPYVSFARDIRAAEREGRRRNPPGPAWGRKPSPITPVQRKALLDALRRGWTYHDACLAARIRVSTVLSWLRLGGYPGEFPGTRPLDPTAVREPYTGFVADVLRAESDYLAGA